MAEAIIRWFQSDVNTESTMRIMAMLGTILGGIMILTGCTMAIVAVIRNTLSTDGVYALGFATAGVGLITGLGFAKAKQAQAENGGAQ